MQLLPPTPPLSDDLVLVRPLDEDDVAAVAAACQDEELLRWTAQIPPHYTEHNARHWIASTTAGWSRGIGEFAVVERRSSAFVGSVALYVRKPWLGEIGYWTAPDRRGRGYATHALRLVGMWAHALGLTRLQMPILVGNAASEAVAAKAGFQLEGTLRAYVDQRGDLRDAGLWARLASDDWP